LGVGLAVVLLGLVGCGGTSTTSNGTGDGGAGRGDGGAGPGVTDAPATVDDAGNVIIDPDAACGAATTRAERLPLDIYLMLDRSQSMSDTVTGGSKWTAVTGALEAFIAQTGLTGVSIGLQYFSLPGTSGGGGGGGVSCNRADYATPDVEIAPLPGVAGAITTSISGHHPGSSTPTSAALQGAIDHAKAWGGAHPDHVTIVILATDGDPTQCDTSLPDIDAIAAAGVSGTPKILTFVIGVGSSLTNLNGIAAAGGTTAPFMVDTGGNVNQQFLDALNNIRGAMLGCTYKMPSVDGGIADLTKVNVQYTPGTGGAPERIPQVPGASQCPASGDAWYYDNPTAPTQIILCPATCSRVQPDTTGEVDILIGCQTDVIG
jgi:hypothetical protein